MSSGLEYWIFRMHSDISLPSVIEFLTLVFRAFSALLVLSVPAKVTGIVQANLRRVWTLGNMSPSQVFRAVSKLSGLFCCALCHFLCQRISSASKTVGHGRCPPHSFFSWSHAAAWSLLLSRSPIIDGTSAKSAAVFCCRGPNLIDISCMGWSTNGRNIALL